MRVRACLRLYLLKQSFAFDWRCNILIISPALQKFSFLYPLGSITHFKNLNCYPSRRNNRPLSHPLPNAFQVGLTRADHHLLRWGAKDIFFKSALMHLCLDVVSARAAVERYEDQHPAFAGCRENLLLKSLVDAAEENDVEALSGAVAKYEQISKLDRWTMTHVWTVKAKLMDDEIDLK